MLINNKLKDYLWEALETFSQDTLRKFIRFCWAQERLPSTAHQYEESKVQLLVKEVSSRDPDSTFPKADTCFFHLTLPSYSSAEILKEKLLQAINLDSGSMNADQGHDWL